MNRRKALGKVILLFLCCSNGNQYMLVKYLGHSGFLLTIEDKSIILDPFITPNELAADLSAADLPCDILLQSHGHEDHIADSVGIASRTGALVVASWEVVNWFANQGVSNGHPMNVGGTKDLGVAKVKMVKAVHSSSFPDGSYAGSAVGFVISTGGKNYYYAGDTALTYDMKLIAEEFDIDCVFFPIGDNFTMGINDAIKAAKFVECNKVIGMHFDTFGYIKIDHEEAINKFRDAGLELLLLEVGQEIDL
jgi:L-ascorbate metabolism protein UlaG (beta-lactamase superfamily)